MLQISGGVFGGHNPGTVMTVSVAATVGAAAAAGVVCAGVLGAPAAFAGAVDFGFTGVVCAVAIAVTNMSAAALKMFFTETGSPEN
ncbi:MAG: hypothetical protein JWN45_2177 [Acidobacteriaceae bacterium]|nr:hypothetical protein [Acidobacteriaceae bacterium]